MDGTADLTVLWNTHVVEFQYTLHPREETPIFHSIPGWTKDRRLLWFRRQVARDPIRRAPDSLPRFVLILLVYFMVSSIN
jgi:hypothetical protein